MTVRKKGNKWYCRFQINGVRYERPCQGATSEKTALQCEVIIKSEIMHGNYDFGKSELSPKLKDAIALMDNYSKTNKRSYNSDKCRLGKIKEYFSGNIQIKEITPAKIEQFKTFLLENNTANSTINRYIALLKKMFNLCIENKLINENPCKSIRKLRENNIKIRFLTKEEEKALFKNITNQVYSNLIKLALYTGMRKSEILNLKWVNIDDNYINILDSKSGKKRHIPNVGNLKRLLNSIPKENEYVFFNPRTGNRLKDITTGFNSILKLAKIKNFRFHDLRHTVATRMVSAGIDLVVVKEILGHSTIQTTMRYAHSLENVKINAIKLLSSY